MALVTLAQAKTHVNVPTGVTTDDNELTFFLDVATELVEGRADRVFTATTSSQVFDGGVSVFVINTSPLASVVSVTVDSVALASTAWAADLQNGIVRTYSTTSAGWSNVSIAYTVGSATVPKSIQMAALETVRHLWETQRGTGRGRNPRSGDEYVPGMGYSLPRRAEEEIERWRNYG